MAAEMGARRRRGLGGLRALWGERARAYGRAVLLSAVIAAALAGLAAHAVNREVSTGTILLFASEHWPFWLAGTGLALVAGALAGRFAPRPRTVEDEDLPAYLRAAEAGSALPTGPLLPLVATFGGVLLVSVYHNRAMIAVAPAWLAAILCGGLVARYHLADPAGGARRAARTAHILLTYGVAFLTLATIYINKVRSLLSATTVALVACLLLIHITDGEHFPADRRLIYGLVGGVTLGEITWALNYWPLTGWTGGALLLIAFYLVAGIILAQVREGLRRRDLLEYGLLSAIAFVLVALSIR